MKKKNKDETDLGRAPEVSLYEQAQQGCGDSLDLLMARHEPLVVYAVNRQNLGDLPFEEGVQAGRLGLWKAILGFDPSRGYQFSTYAYPAILHYVWIAVKDHCVANKKEHTTREWKEFFRHWEAGPAQRQSVRELQECLAALVARLPKRLRRVVRVRYEVDGEAWQTLAELGAELGLCGERVRQLQVEALVWLRHPAHSQELRELLRRHSLQEYEWAEEVAQTWLRRRGGRRTCKSGRYQYSQAWRQPHPG
jgi:RNA polymerase sigma factor (sigma-70 family)